MFLVYKQFVHPEQLAVWTLSKQLSVCYYNILFLTFQHHTQRVESFNTHNGTGYQTTHTHHGGYSTLPIHTRQQNGFALIPSNNQAMMSNG